MVRGKEDDGQGLRFNDLEVILDKKHYAPGDTARILVNTNQPGATVLLFLRGSGSVAEELQLLKVKGKSREYELKLEKRDMPNTFIEAVTIARGRVVSVVKEIVLPPEKRFLKVEVVPDKGKYKPRENGKVTIRLTDEQGEPFVGSTVLTVYDKSLEYISGGSNVADISKAFWEWKRGYSRGALAHSQVLGGQNLGEPDKPYMQLLGRFGGMVADEFGRRGGLGGGGARSLRMNKAAMPGAAQFYRSADAEGAVLTESLALDAAAAPMEDNGDGQGGDGGQPEVVVRSEFADLVKWGRVGEDQRARRSGHRPRDARQPYHLEDPDLGHGARDAGRGGDGGDHYQQGPHRSPAGAPVLHRGRPGDSQRGGA